MNQQKNSSDSEKPPQSKDSLTPKTIEEIDDMSAYASLMKKGLESPEGEFERLTQEVYDELDLKDAEKN